MVAKFWESVVGQDDAVTSLRNAQEAGTLSHAYLFIGPEGLGKINAAKALAAGIMCPDGGCGRCATCLRLKRGTHPDFHVLEPEGATYLIEQIRTLIHDASLAPMESTHKFYVLRNVDLLGESAANALLKTLEEPSDDVTFILLAHQREGVLPTIASRCIDVRFVTLPMQTMIEQVTRKTGCDVEQARIALVACGSVISEAVEFVRSPQRREGRAAVVRVFLALPDADDLDILVLAKELTASLKGPVGEMQQRQEEERLEQAELLDARARKLLEERDKRTRTVFEKRITDEALNTLASLLRDTLGISVGASDVLNFDLREKLAALPPVTPAAVDRQFETIAQAHRSVALNISTQFVLEHVLLEMREVWQCPK